MGRLVYQGSSRVGELVLPELQAFSPEETLVETELEDIFILQLIYLGLTFLGLVILASVLLLGQTKLRFLYAGLVAVLLLAGGYWYISYAAEVYESEDYRQFRYTISVDPKIKDEYWISFAAIDTYTQRPPQNQEVEITLDGSTWSLFINDNTGAEHHLRSITVSELQAPTTAIRVVSGCASYYGFSNFGASSYGTRNCEPLPLLPSDESITGCMDPSAVNYNPKAVISSDDCRYGLDDTPPNPPTGVDSPTGVNPPSDGPGCIWLPADGGDPVYCRNREYGQVNSCSGEQRTIWGTLDESWQPQVNPSDICVGKSIRQYDRCSANTRDVLGTNNIGTSFCLSPDASFVLSTNLIRWTTCDEVNQLRLVRPDQPIYLRSVGNVDITEWTVSHSQITGDIVRHEEDVYKTNLSFNGSQKNYQNVVIRGSAGIGPGNNASQTCNIAVLSVEFEER